MFTYEYKGSMFPDESKCPGFHISSHESMCLQMSLLLSLSPFESMQVFVSQYESMFPYKYICVHVFYESICLHMIPNGPCFHKSLKVHVSK